MTNIVIVVMDTARHETVRDLGDELEHLSSLAEAGTQYSAAYANAPWTLPSHASLFTATTPSKHGAHAGHKRLSDEPTTVAEVFDTNGYETVAVSNNTWISEEFGFDRGFQTFRKTWQYVQTDIDLGRIARMEAGPEKFTKLARALLRGNPIVNLANAIYGQFFRRQYDDGARQTNEWLRDWLGERADTRPFFLFVNYLEPHLEYRPPEEFAMEFLPPGVSYDEAMDVPQDAWEYIVGTVEMSESDFEILRCLYRAEIAYMDHRIGELKRHLQTHDEWKDTVLVVTGDHGENIGDHGLMDHQYCLYDTLLHTPLIIHGGAFADGASVDDLIQLADLAPTLLDEAGIDAPEFRMQAQGQSFHPDTGTDPREEIVAEYVAPQPSMEALEQKTGALPDHVRRYDRSLRAVRTTEWKFIRGSDGSIELYDVTADPGETAEIADQHPDIVASFDQAVDEWVDSFEHADYDGEVSMRDETKERLEDLGYLQ